MFFRDFFNTLEEEKVMYLAIGGVAVNMHGYNRITGDIDIMISFNQDNIKKLENVCKKLNLKPRVPIELVELSDPKKRDFWKKEKNMRVFSLVKADDDFIVIDIMIEDYIDFVEAYKKRKYVDEVGIKISVVSIDDLIKLKEIANKSRDIGDIEALKKLKELENGKES